jgi:chromosome segregation ATPase
MDAETALSALADKLTQIQVDIGVIKTTLSERKDSVDKNAKNIGEAFDAIKNVQASQTAILHEIRALAEKVNIHETRLAAQEENVRKNEITLGQVRDKVLGWGGIIALATAGLSALVVKIIAR